MIALMWLMGATILAGAWRHPAARAGAVLAACVGGTTLPDIDFLLWLSHRSALTHSVLPILLLGAWRPTRPIAAGAAAGLGLHLAADCFPNAMRGYATVKLPLAGSIGTTASYLWLLVNAGAALAWGAFATARDLRNPWRWIAMAGYTVVGAGYLVATDGGWPPLAIFAVAGWLAVRRRKIRRTI
jgi:hypothetical protein